MTCCQCPATLTDAGSSYAAAATAPSARNRAACSASASTSGPTAAVSGCTSTRSPSSAAVSAVFGPMHLAMVRACGLPAVPTRLRTVELEVKQTASKPPVLIISRVSAGGGAPRAVRYAIDVLDLPAALHQASASVSVAMSARGSSTRFTGSKISSYSGNSSSRPIEDWLAGRHQFGLIPKARTRSAVDSPTHAIFTPEKARATELGELLPDRANGVGGGEHHPLEATVHQALDGPFHLSRAARRFDRDGRHLDRRGAVGDQPSLVTGLLLGPGQHRPAVQGAALHQVQLGTVGHRAADGDHHCTGHRAGRVGGAEHVAVGETAEGGLHRALRAGGARSGDDARGGLGQSVLDQRSAGLGQVRGGCGEDQRPGCGGQRRPVHFATHVGDGVGGTQRQARVTRHRDRGGQARHDLEHQMTAGDGVDLRGDRVDRQRVAGDQSDRPRP